MSTGLKGYSRLPRETPRARRNASKLSDTFVEFLGDGLSIVGDGIISIDLATTPGLTFISGGLAALTQGVLSIDSSGIKLNFGTGLRNDSGTLKSKDSEIIHDNLSGFVANKHVDHSSVSISAGTGLGGGGDITATRTISLSSATTAVIGGIKQSVSRADSSQNTVTLTSVTMPADSPASADALRDDLVTNALANLSTRDGELETAIETLAGEFNDLLSKLRTSGALAT